MKLPNYDSAFIDIRKLRDYCLNPRHSVGRHKARVFKSTLGIEQKDAEFLKERILQALPHSEATVSYEDVFGTRYMVELQLNNEEQSATVITVWMIPKGSKKPHLVTCYAKN